MGRTLRRMWGRRIQAAVNLLLISLAFYALLPILWGISVSLKNNKELFVPRPSFIPKHPSLWNYIYVIREAGSYGIERSRLPLGEFGRFFINSCVVSGGTVLLIVLISSMAGYAYARRSFRGRDVFFYGTIVMMFIPSAGGLMATYELMHFLHLRDNLFGLILLFASSPLVYIFIMRQAFLSVPRELEDAAKRDGCNAWQLFWEVDLRLVTGAVVVVAIFSFISVWGEFLVTYTMIDRRELLTISVAIQSLQFIKLQTVQVLHGETAEACSAAANLMAAVPVVLVYLGMQRWFVQGIQSGILKL